VLITESHADVVLTDDTTLRLSGPELARVYALRAALARHAETGDPADLGVGFAVARELIAALPGTGPSGQPDLEGLRRLA
jgi:hypothetical protein